MSISSTKRKEKEQPPQLVISRDQISFPSKHSQKQEVVHTDTNSITYFRGCYSEKTGRFVSVPTQENLSSAVARDETMEP